MKEMDLYGFVIFCDHFLAGIFSNLMPTARLTFFQDADCTKVVYPNHTQTDLA